jgi:predicted RNA binding protein YcfA (HicA-like mRNA interferase family)
MPKLPVLSGDSVIKALEQLGFHRARQRGSHVVMRRGRQGTVVPLHREIKVGTLAGLLRQAQVDPEQFLAAIA